MGQPSLSSGPRFSMLPMSMGADVMGGNYASSDVVSSRAARGHFRGPPNGEGGPAQPRGRTRLRHPPLRRLYLIHGTRDDNVHLQHTAVLSRALVRDGVTFRQQVMLLLLRCYQSLLLTKYLSSFQIYPDAAHSLHSVRPHLYLSIENYIDHCFQVEMPNMCISAAFRLHDSHVILAHPPPSLEPPPDFVLRGPDLTHY